MGQAENDELIEQVRREMGKVGVHGTLVVLAGGTLELREAGGVPIGIDIALVLEQWSLLPPELRARKVEDITRRLMVARGPRPGASLLDDAATRRRAAFAVAGLLGVLFLVGTARMVVPRLTAPPPPPPKVASEADSERTARLARACDAVRDRIRTNANFGPIALEGFVVELWLAGKQDADLKAHPALTGLVRGGKLSPAADERLALVLGGEVAIEDGLDREAAARWEGWRAARVVFRDGFGRAFFEDENRPRFLGLADRLARATGATHGALTARCAHEAVHAVGAWFRGPDAPGVAASLIYQMGFFSDEKIIDARARRELASAGGELEALAREATKADDLALRLAGSGGGSFLTGPPPTLQFGLPMPSRSLTATRDLARRLGIAAE